jgi:hypothetical protein
MLAAGVLAILSGCAIHPLPEDVTGVDTLDIVKQIRCETRAAAIDLLLAFLEDQGKDYPNSPGNPIARDLAVQYARNPNLISASLPTRFNGYPNTQSVINLLFAVGIAYNFELRMTEDNDLSADVSFLRPLTQPKFTLGIKAGAARKRNNTRTFTVTDTFRGLLTELNQKKRADRYYCDGHIVKENYIYPIAGRIGVDKLTRDFIDLTIFGNLGGKDAKPDAPGPPTMADELTFTTTINASATPKIEFTPVTSAFRLASASLTGELKRTDYHQVTVGLAIVPTGASHLTSLRGYLFAPGGGPTPTIVPRSATKGATTFVGNRVTASGTSSEILAVIAIDQLKSRQFQLIPPP